MNLVPGNVLGRAQCAIVRSGSRIPLFTKTPATISTAHQNHSTPLSGPHDAGHVYKEILIGSYALQLSIRGVTRPMLRARRAMTLILLTSTCGRNKGNSTVELPGGAGGRVLDIMHGRIATEGGYNRKHTSTIYTAQDTRYHKILL